MRERTIEKTAALLASSLLFFIASGCGSDEDSSDGTGGKGTGGASGASSGGTAGTASGGTAGAPSGGTGGAASGGVAGTASGGAAGTASGGAAGATDGGTGGGGTDGGNTGWGCTETPTTCACSAANPSAQGACLNSYTCCYQTKQECHCLNLPSQQCAQTIKSLKASQVSTCPPP